MYIPEWQNPTLWQCSALSVVSCTMEESISCMFVFAYRVTVNNYSNIIIVISIGSSTVYNSMSMRQRQWHHKCS